MLDQQILRWPEPWRQASVPVMIRGIRCFHGSGGRVPLSINTKKPRLCYQLNRCPEHDKGCNRPSCTFQAGHSAMGAMCTTWLQWPGPCLAQTSDLRA